MGSVGSKFVQSVPLLILINCEQTTLENQSFYNCYRTTLGNHCLRQCSVFLFIVMSNDMWQCRFFFLYIGFAMQNVSMNNIMNDGHTDIIDKKTDIVRRDDRDDIEQPSETNGIIRFLKPPLRIHVIIRCAKHH